MQPLNQPQVGLQGVSTPTLTLGQAQPLLVSEHSLKSLYIYLPGPEQLPIGL